MIRSKFKDYEKKIQIEFLHKLYILKSISIKSI